MAWTEWEKVEGFDLKEVIYEKKFRDTHGGVARVTINRPERMNAFTQDTLEELGLAIDDADHDPLIGVILLTGAGDNFGTGGDVVWESSGSAFRKGFYYGVDPDHYVKLARKPVIAVVRGFCIAGSHHLAYFCDLTLAADNAIFGQNGPRVGSPADAYCVAYASRVMGEKKAREMWMLCRRYSAQQAYEMGLVNKLVPEDKLDEEVDQWCDEILSLSPDCIEVVKASFDAEIETLPAGRLGLQSRLMLPDWFDGEEIQEGQQAFLEKRQPNFWKVREAKAEARKNKKNNS
ncbi:enoyl-CoA hydratase-related protein [Desulfosarcina ovata]|uniref:1,4-dihydroxy-2-naphthoyl-CoA synthase n=2 Tax=Desulfosarcina ovata TaxID=83564 RepID=A0A5K8A9I0_9BACT|nr:enoyl-CoA hydratase-related protein [Desulfosarcina ovata]BBO82028.1 1,4-dihydroxy-2-naphthoyl-CoA synthase [Desulfosarcina ovata subsp. sediminis]BBO89252.1 1,4-dihydroxy-2-naphthoyl-CoA synthase [Desulfosarcina ovata subsp. ovata]